MAFTCSLLVEDRIARITLTGELDAASASGFRDRIAEAALQDPPALVLMMEKLDYMASAGLRTLIFAKQKWAPAWTSTSSAPRSRSPKRSN